MNQAELEAQAETDYLLKDPTLKANIAAARREYHQEETLSMEQVFGG